LADVTLENTLLFLCRVMVFGTWADICFVLDHHGKAAFRGVASRSCGTEDESPKIASSLSPLNSIRNTHAQDRAKRIGI
jgi:hypothetical protein